MSHATLLLSHVPHVRVKDGRMEILHGSPADVSGYSTLEVEFGHVPEPRVAIAAAALDGDMAEVKRLVEAMP